MAEPAQLCRLLCHGAGGCGATGCAARRGCRRGRVGEPDRGRAALRQRVLVAAVRPRPRFRSGLTPGRGRTRSLGGGGACTCPTQACGSVRLRSRWPRSLPDVREGWRIDLKHRGGGVSGHPCDSVTLEPMSCSGTTSTCRTSISRGCLLYTSDAADDLTRVDL